MLAEWTGVAAMIGPWSTGKRLAVLATALVVGGTALFSIAGVYPKPVSSGLLGSEWQCQRVVFLVTCTRLEEVERNARGLGRRFLAGRPV
jgi:hypothetical protein